MNELRTQKLFAAMTDIREDYIEEAAPGCPVRRFTLPRAALAAAACLVLLLAPVILLSKLGRISLSPGPAAAGGGSGEGRSYMLYTGPVFPLTVLEDEGLTAERTVTFDFSSYEEPRSSYDRKITVTDDYVLGNPTGEDRSYTLLYPLVLDDRADRAPAVTVEGAAVEAETIVGPFSDRTGRLPRLQSWEDYKTWLGEDYLDRTLAEPPALDIPVVVYELHDMWGERTEESTNPTLALEFYPDRAQTAVLSYGFNGSTYDPETGFCRRHVSIPRPGTRREGSSAYLLVLGEDLSGYTLRAYTNGGCDVPMEEAGGTVTRYLSTLGEMVQKLLQLELEADLTELGDEAPGLGEELRASTRARDLIAVHWGETGLLAGDYARFWQGNGSEWMLEDAFSHLRATRLMYLRFTVAIPAGESRRVTVKAEKRPSHDFVGSRKDLERNGYDLVTRLGSRLAFTRQEAALAGAEHIRILEQDFGFDPAAGILRVTLDPGEEHYFLDVEAVKTDG